MPQYLTCRVSDLRPDPDNHRKSLTKIEELAESIATCGLLQNLVVRESTVGLMVVAGHRRLAALNLLVKAGRYPDEVTVLVIEGSGVFESLTENIQRDDVPCWVLGQRYAELADAGYTQGHIGEKLGISSGAVSMRIKIATNLSPEILTRLDKLPDKKAIGISVLYRMAQLYNPETFEPDHEQQRKMLDRYLSIGGREHGRHAKKLVPEKERVYRRFKIYKDGRVRVPSTYAVALESFARYLVGETEKIEVL